MLMVGTTTWVARFRDWATDEGRVLVVRGREVGSGTTISIDGWIVARFVAKPQVINQELHESVRHNCLVSSEG
jgi:hypothetical protein